MIENKAFITIENSRISTSRRTRAGWHIKMAYEMPDIHKQWKPSQIYIPSHQGRPMNDKRNE